MRTPESILEEAVKQLAGKRVLASGEVVAINSNPITGEVIKYQGDVVLVDHQDGTLRWPANEVFSPNDALRLCRKMQAEDWSKGAPKGLGTFVVAL